MTQPKAAIVEAMVNRLMTLGIRLIPGCLLAGLVVWLIQPQRVHAGVLLRVGLFSLMAIPMLRVVGSLAGALHARNWLFLASTVAVLVELAVTFITAYNRR